MNKDNFIDFLIYTSVFICTIVFFFSPFEGYIHYFIFLALLPFFVRRYGLPKTPFQIIIIPFFVGIFQVFLGNNEWFLFIKIFLGILLSTTFYYYVIQYYELNVEKMFRLYLKWAYWSAVIGVIQFISFKLHFSPGYDYNWLFSKWTMAVEGPNIRISSFYLEPSQLGIMLAPAAFIAIYNILNRTQFEYKQYQNFMILAAIYLSKSSTGYIGIFLAIFMVGINLGYIMYLVFFIMAGILAGIGLYNTVDEFRQRVDASTALWIDQDFSIKNVNTSSFVQYNNAHIAYNNLKEHPLFGTGIGSFPKAYNKYSYTKSVVKLKGFEFNSQDGNSLFLRMMAETGLIGLLFFLFVIKSAFVRNDGKDKIHWLISASLLVLLLLYLLRQGNYFLNGFPFFVWLYYYNKVVYNQKKFGLNEPA